jgi:ABC-type polysaccharide/polyol phosphate export permease
VALLVYDSAQRRSPFTDEFFSLLRYRELLNQLVARNIKTRYKRSVLGIAWTMINPLMMMAVLAVVFSRMFSTTIEHYTVYLLASLTVWTFFSQTSSGIMTELIWGGKLLSKIYVPPSVFAISALGTSLVNMLLSLIPLFAIMLITGSPFTLSLLFLPVAIVLNCMFALGIGLMLARMAIFFADVLEMYQILLMIWFYATPIIYPIGIVTDERRYLLLMNPMYYMVEVFRAPIYAGTLPDLRVTAIAFAFAFGTLTVGWWYFTRKADEFAYRV